MKKKVIKEKRYTVDCICGNHCYATHTNCKWDDVKRLKATAKALGETIKYKHTDTVTYEY